MFVRGGMRRVLRDWSRERLVLQQKSVDQRLCVELCRICGILQQEVGANARASKHDQGSCTTNYLSRGSILESPAL